MPVWPPPRQDKAAPPVQIQTRHETRAARPQKKDRQRYSAVSDSSSNYSSVRNVKQRDPPTHPQMRKDPGTFSEVYQESFLAKPLMGTDGHMGYAATLVTFVNSIIGPWVVVLPFLASLSGFVPFFIYLAVAALTAAGSMHLLVHCTERAPGAMDYDLLGNAAFGAVGMWLTRICFFCQYFGGCTAYLSLIGTSAPAAAKILGIQVDSSAAVKWLTLLVVLPQCLLRDGSALMSLSFFGLMIYLVIVAVLVLHASQDHWYESDVAHALNITEQGHAKMLRLDLDFKSFAEFPLLLFAFACQQACLPVYAELRDATIPKMNEVSRGATILSFVVYAIVGFFGYMAYTTKTLSSVILNMRHCDTFCTEASMSFEQCPVQKLQMRCQDDDNFFQMINLGFLCALLTGYPRLHYQLRHVLVKMALGADSSFSCNAHVGMGVVNVVATLLMALAVEDTTKILGWTGAIASSFVVCILPASFYLRLFGNEGDLTVGQRALGILMAIFGVMTAVVGVVAKMQ